MGPSINRTAVVLDPHPVWVDAMVALLEEIEVEVVGRTILPERALELVEGLTPTLLVVEPRYALGAIDGFEVIRRARKLVLGIKIVAVGGALDSASIDAALDAGAIAYVVKTAQAAEIMAALRLAFDPSIFFTTNRPAGKGGSLLQVDGGRAKHLTAREQEILRLVAEGHSNGRLASMLWITEQTVKYHLSNIYRKLGVNNRTEASRWAQQHGLLGAPGEPEPRAPVQAAGGG